MIAILELVLAAEDFSIDTQKRRIKLTNCYHRYFQINLYKKSSLSGVLRKKKPTQWFHIEEDTTIEAASAKCNMEESMQS